MAQMVKNRLQCRRPRVPSLGWEDPLEKRILQYSCLENSLEEPTVANSWTQLSDKVHTWEMKY